MNGIVLLLIMGLLNLVTLATICLLDVELLDM